MQAEISDLPFLVVPSKLSVLDFFKIFEATVIRVSRVHFEKVLFGINEKIIGDFNLCCGLII